MQYANHTTDSTKKIILFHVLLRAPTYRLYLADELISGGCYKTMSIYTLYLTD